MFEGLSRFASFQWLDLPNYLRLPVLSDGKYLFVYPIISLCLFLTAIFLGMSVFIIGIHPTYLITHSSILFLALLVVTTFGGGLGFVIWLVYSTFFVVGQFLRLEDMRYGPLGWIGADILYLIIIYTLLANIPKFSHSLSTQILPAPLDQRYPSLNLILRLIGFPLFHSCLVLSWCLAFPFLIRPYYAWRHHSIPVPEISFVQENSLLIWTVVFAAAAVRIILELAAELEIRKDKIFSYLYRSPLSIPLFLPPFVREAFTAIMWTFFMSGLFYNWLQASISFALIFLVFIASSMFFVNFKNVGRWLYNIPSWIRIAVASFIAFEFATATVIYFQEGEGGFRNILISVLIVTPIYAFFMRNNWESLRDQAIEEISLAEEFLKKGIDQ